MLFLLWLGVIDLSIAGCKESQFYCCHLSKLYLACTSPKSFPPTRNYLIIFDEQWLQFLCSVNSSPPPQPPTKKKKIDFPIGPVNNRIHLPDSQFTSPRLLDTISLHTVYTGHWALGFTTFFFSDVLQICAQARQPLGLVFIFITSYPMGQEKSMAHLHSLTIFSGACDLKSHISCQLALTSRE